MPRKKKPIAVVVAATTVALSGQLASAAPRLAPPGCDFHEVVKGDTVWRIATQANVTLDVVARLNPQITNLSLVYPGDQVATVCGVVKPEKLQAPAPPPPAEAAHADQVLEAPNVVTKQAVLAALYNQGARGNQLIGLAAVTDAESGRRLDAVGDANIATGKWDYSAGVWQIRGVKDQRGQGTTRDVERNHTLEGGAKSAVELFNQAQERGQDPLSPWSVHLNGWDAGQTEVYRQLATDMKLLEKDK